MGGGRCRVRRPAEWVARTRIIRLLRRQSSQGILIHGGAPAVGAHAVQLASHAGATVIATASRDDSAYLNSIGASQVIDYREAAFEAAILSLRCSPYRRKRPRGMV